MGSQTRGCDARARGSIFAAMGMIRASDQVKLFCGLLASERSLIPEAVERIEARCGPADFCSLPVEFTFTDYYASEMGAGLLRLFVSFERRIDPEEIRAIKIETNRIEEEMAAREPGRDGWKRRVNIDPGFITPHSVSLASTKNFQHRIPIGGGIYLEQEMFFTKTGARFLPWTYPDYRTDHYVAVLRIIRQKLLARDR